MKIKRRRFLENSGHFILTGGFASFFGSTILKERDNQEGIFSDRDNTDLEKLKYLLQRKEGNIWLFTGDSITQGAKHTHGYRSYPEVFQERIRWEMSRLRDIVINTGMSGNAATNILSDFDWRIGQFNPNLVSVMIGTNDCAREGMKPAQFHKNVTELISRIRKINAIPVLHTPNPIILDKSPERATLPDYIPVLRQLAEVEKVVLVDNYQYWEETSREKSTDFVFNNWLNDPLHPNQFGHREIARLMFKKMDIFDPEASTCGGPYYEGIH